jgi:hypothetical protein
MIELSAVALEWLAVGALVTIAGGLIKFRGWTFLIAGYDASTPVPEAVAREMAGNTILRVGIAVLAFSVLSTVTNPPTFLSAVIGVAIVVDVLRLIYRANAYPSTGS